VWVAKNESNIWKGDEIISKDLKYITNLVIVAILKNI